MKKLILLLIIGLAATMPQKTEYKPISDKVYAKGKPLKSKRKSLKKKYDSLGTYTLTAYCGCARCCGRAGARTSTGTVPKANHTVAVDPRVIPYGSELIINGITYTAEDCGSGVKGKHIDIYFDTHKEALAFGKQKAEVFKEKPKKLKIAHVKPSRIKKVVHNKVIMLAKEFRRKKVFN